MAAPEHITARIRNYLVDRVIPVIPAEIHAVTFEVTSWHIRIHMYQYGVLEDHTDSPLENRIEQLAELFPPRDEEPWQVTPAFHRRDRGSPFSPEGEVVYAV